MVKTVPSGHPIFQETAQPPDSQNRQF